MDGRRVCVYHKRNGRGWKRVRPEAATQHASQAAALTTSNAMTTISYTRRSPTQAQLS